MVSTPLNLARNEARPVHRVDSAKMDSTLLFPEEESAGLFPDRGSDVGEDMV